MSDPIPESKNNNRSSWLVWLVPLVALIASGWLLHRQYRDSGPVITIDFANGTGIQVGKTALIHQGVAVGLVQSVALNPKLDGVTVQVELDPSAARLAVQGSEFWLVQPEIGLTGVKGLETLISGAQLRVHAGDGAPAQHFQALPKAPAREAYVAGRQFVLRADKLGSLHPGAPVMYREVKVGAVDSHRIADDGTQVLITINVFEPFYRLVRKETQFWNAGGISMKLNLLGAQVHSNSLESLVAGGVAFATPETTAAREPAAEGTEFSLNDEAEKAWLKWQPKIDLTQPAT
jgi:paraquat-inducible protein B